MNEDTDDKGFNDYLWSHALISDEIYTKLTQNCSNAAVNSEYCNSLEEELGEEIGDIDFYNIYGPICPRLPHGLTVRKTRHSGLDPCEGNYVEAYLNLPNVQKAFHANVTKLSYPWATCRYDHLSGQLALPVFKRLYFVPLKPYDLAEKHVDVNECEFMRLHEPNMKFIMDMILV